jgi:hypothetical protein
MFWMLTRRVIGNLTYAAEATSTGGSITIPSAGVAGTLLVLWDFAVNSSGAPTSVVPPDFIQVAQVASGVRKGILSYKIAVGGDASSSITGMDGTSTDGKCLLVFSSTTSISSAAVRSVNQEITDGNPAMQTITAGSGNPPLIVIGATRHGNNGSRFTMSPTQDGTVSSDDGASNRSLAYKIYNSSPSNVTFDMADEGNGNALVSCYIEIS